MNVVAMIIESYALESIWLLVLSIIKIRNVAMTGFFAESVVYIEVSLP
jgi:hypothetical protein